MTATTYTLSAENATKPVFLGSSIDAETEALLKSNGVATTRDPAGSVVAMTLSPAELPASVEWVHSPYMGVDSLVGRLPATVKLLTRTVDGMPTHMADYTLTAVKAERWQWQLLLREQSEGIWVKRPILRSVGDRKALVIGTGHVGATAGRALRPVFPGLLGVSHSGRAVEGFDTVWALGDVAIPWSQVDCLVIALPLTASTTNIVSDSIFTALHDAHVIMIGRGATVDFDALHRAIQAGNVRHATIDVYPVEPPTADEWFWSDPDVTMTPHISGIPDPMDPVASFLNARRALMEGRQPEGIVEKERGY